MAEDCSPQHGPSRQPVRSESSLTEPEVTDEETIEDESAVEQQECGDRRGCDLSKDSAAPTKRPRTDATLPSEKASDCKQQCRERPSPKAGGLKGNTSAMSRSASSSPARGERHRNVPLKYGGLLTSTPSIFINLFAGLDQDINGYSQKAKVPLVIHELHFTMDDPGAAVAAAKANPVTAAYALFNITHDVLLGIGGFVLFYGRWKPRTPIKLLYSGTTVAEFTAPDDGQEVVLVKMYQGSFAASAASDSKSPPIIVTQKETVLSKLVVTEYEKIFEYKAGILQGKQLHFLFSSTYEQPISVVVQLFFQVAA
ncbi:hypothetical protein MRX96_005833 [Rhipicephalus microplus]